MQRCQPTSAKIVKHIDNRWTTEFRDLMLSSLMTIADHQRNGQRVDGSLIDLLRLADRRLRTTRGGRSGDRDILRNLRAPDAPLMDTDDDDAGGRGRRTSDDQSEPARYNERRAKALIMVGEVSRAMKALRSGASLEADDETLAKLEALHPQATLPNWTPVPSTRPRFTVTAQEVVIAAKRLPKGAAAGPSALSFEHLKATIVRPGSQDCAQEWANFIQAYANGELRFGELGLNAWLSAKLIALDKGAGAVRPIAIGECVLRLVHSVIARKVSSELGDILRPVQMAIGTKNGTEAMIHSTRSYFQRYTHSAMLLTDVKNAFNTINRQAIIDGVDKYCPVLSHVARTTLCHAGLLWLRRPDGSYHVIRSTRGVRQGDPLSVIFFALGFHDVIIGLKQRSESTFASAYADDLCVLAPLCHQATLIERVQRSCQERGLEIVEAKTKIYCPGATNNRLRGNDRIEVNSEGVIHVGAPIGTDEFVTTTLRHKLNGFSATVSLIVNASRLSVQEKMILLLWAAAPKLTYLARVIEPRLARQPLTEATRLLDEAIANVLKLSPQDHNWLSECPANELLWHLPVRFGGHGFPNVGAIGPYAYMASVVQATRVLQSSADHLSPWPPRSAALEPLTSAYDTWQWIVERHALAHQQHDVEENGGTVTRQVPLTDPLMWLEQFSTDRAQQYLTGYHYREQQQRMVALINEMAHNRQRPPQRDTSDRTDRQIARLLSIQHPKSATWLTNIPTSQELRMDDADYRTCFRLRCGLPVPTIVMHQPYQCPDCHRTIEPDDVHAFTCTATNAPKTRRHNQLTKTWRRLLATVGKQSTNEPWIPQTDGPATRRGDVMWLENNRDVRIIGDFSVTHPAAQTYIQSARTAGGAAERRRRDKHRDYQNVTAHAPEGVIFRPLVMETYGRPDVELEECIRETADDLPEQGITPSGFCQLAWRLMATALQKENAKMINRHRDRIPFAGSTPASRLPPHAAHQNMPCAYEGRRQRPHNTHTDRTRAPLTPINIRITAPALAYQIDDGVLAG